MKRVALVALLALLVSTLPPWVWGQSALSGDSQSIPAMGGRGVENTDNLRHESFEIVWRTVKEKHFDPTFGGVDWDKVHDQYAPRIASVTSDSQFYDLLQQMLGELHQSHFGIIRPEEVTQDDSPEPAIGGIGVDLRIVDGQATVTRVESGSSADRAGIRLGFIVKKIDDADILPIIEKLAARRESAALRKIRTIRAILALINGPPGTSVRISWLDGQEAAGEATIPREKLKGEMSQRFGNFPPQYVEFESKRLPGNIGYIRFNIFVILVMDKIRAAIRSMSDESGLIVDLRGNPGGVGGMSSGIAGLLEDKQTSLGTMRMRVGHQNFLVFPQKDPYLGPVVILMDQMSASTSEVFASGMQEIGRAVVVGEQSAGAALPSIIQKLPTGALFQYAIADFKTPKGTLIEGRGVIPDVEIKLSRAALLAGSDAQLDAAIASVRKHVGLARRPRTAA